MNRKLVLSQENTHQPTQIQKRAPVEAFLTQNPQPGRRSRRGAERGAAPGEGRASPSIPGASSGVPEAPAQGRAAPWRYESGRGWLWVPLRVFSCDWAMSARALWIFSSSMSPRYTTSSSRAAASWFSSSSRYRLAAFKAKPAWFLASYVLFMHSCLWMLLSHSRSNSPTVSL